MQGLLGIADEDAGVFFIVLLLLGVALLSLVLGFVYLWATGRQAERRFALRMQEANQAKSHENVLEG